MTSTDLPSSIVSPRESYALLPQSYLSERDLPLLLDFYMPIIGAHACFVYLLLSHEEAGVVKAHSELFSRARISQGEFQSALDALSALGLLRVYKKDEGCQGPDRIYALYAPQKPQDFMGKTSLASLLQKNLSEEERAALKKRYASYPIPEEGYKDLSKNLFDVFGIDSALSLQSESGFLSEGSAAPNAPWNEEAFRAALGEECPDLPYDKLSPEEQKAIEGLSKLYLFDEETMASLVAKAHAPNTSYIDLDALRAEAKKESESGFSFTRASEKRGRDTSLSGDSGIAQTLRAAENQSPIAFLTILQHGKAPVWNDARLLKRLEEEVGLPTSVINALVFYVVQTQDGRLSDKYVMKIAGTLLRKGFSNALDAFNYLWSGYESRKTKKPIQRPSFSRAPKREEEALKPQPANASPASAEADDEPFDFDAYMADDTEGKE